MSCVCVCVRKGSQSIVYPNYFIHLLKASSGDIFNREVLLGGMNWGDIVDMRGLCSECWKHDDEKKLSVLCTGCTEDPLLPMTTQTCHFCGTKCVEMSLTFSCSFCVHKCRIVDSNREVVS